MWLSFARAPRFEAMRRAGISKKQARTFHGLAMSLLSDRLKPVSPQFADRVWADTWRRVTGTGCSMSQWSTSRCREVRNLLTYVIHTSKEEWETVLPERIERSDELAVVTEYLRKLRSLGTTDPDVFLVELLNSGKTVDVDYVFLDEAQDLSPLMCEVLCRVFGICLPCSSGREVSASLIAALDDDQMIFDTLHGAYVDWIIELVGSSDIHVLSQSRRVPRTVWEVANAVVARLSKRVPKRYLPRPANGLVYYTRSVVDALQFAKRVYRSIGGSRFLVLTYRNDAALKVIQGIYRISGRVPMTFKELNTKAERLNWLYVDTIDAAKGSEGDVVVLITGRLRRDVDRDHLIRVTYVGVTRARHALIVVLGNNEPSEVLEEALSEAKVI